jgi:tetratricopeptide (TPR) repeat protein
LKTTPPAGKTEARRAIWVCVFLALAVLAVFGQTARFGFVGYDDDENVYQNPVVERGLSVQSAGWAFTHPQTGNWIPLTTLSHMLDCQVFGLNAGGHHLVSVLWHAADAVLLFLVLRRMTGSLWRSAIAAAVFAVHPLRAESVAWVSERKDVLSGFFFMLTIGAYVRYAERCKMQNAKCKIYYALALVFFVLGLLAKSMVATLPFVLLLLDYWPLGRMGRGQSSEVGGQRSQVRDQRSEVRSQRSKGGEQAARKLPFWGLVREKIPLFALSAGACVAAALVPGLVITDAHRLPLLERIANALVSYVVYLWQMVFPAGLAAPYPYPANGQPRGEVFLALVLLAAITAFAMWWRKQHPCLLMGWLWYLGMLLPVIGIVQISSDAAHADRYTYLPGIGLVIAVIWTVADWSAGWKRRPVLLAGLMTTVIGVLAVCGYLQTSCWSNNESLWTHSLACTSSNSIACNNLGAVLAKNGKLEPAILLFRKALAIEPDYVAALNNLGNALEMKGDIEGAIALYREALRIKPASEFSRYRLGVVLSSKGETEEAIAQYREVLAMDAPFAPAHLSLGVLLGKSGQVDDAIAQYRKTLELKPDWAEAHLDLGAALGAKDQWPEAIAHFRKALELKPGYAQAHFGLGAAFAAKEQLEEAITQYRKALELKPDYAEANFGLGKALLRKGDFAGAMSCFSKTSALGLDSLATWLNLGREFVQRGDWEEALVCYRQAMSINPRCADACANLGLVFFQKGEAKEAVNCWQRALEIKPDQANVQNNLAWLLATASDASLRNGAKAIALAERANQLNGGSNAPVLHTLAAAYAETGRFGDATATARRALELATAQKNEDLTAQLPNEIKLYEADKPMRDVPH